MKHVSKQQPTESISIGLRIFLDSRFSILFVLDLFSIRPSIIGQLTLCRTTD